MDRDRFTELTTLIEKIRTPGELNYCITMLCKALPQSTYADLNTVMGVLECAKQEFYRVKCVPYEDLKIKENGAV